ncbi:nucleoside phosphorylase domain-containing protein [Aspergillus aurantiobrunneus]
MYKYDYTVGWICALDVEYLAAQLCLDEEHDDVSSNASAADSNYYTLGRIGKHNVVMTILPIGEYGTIPAASVLKDMLHAFPNIRVGLMVGIGGVPTNHDIRLGDVVVSTPSNGSSGVYHYGFGKTIQGRSFVDITQYRRKGHQMDQRIDDILAKERPLVRQDHSRPDLATDKLFKPELIHDDICGKNGQCIHNEANLVSRHERTELEDSPTIHYGTIASGNTVIRDAIVRDKLAKGKDVLCFEMEAAGLMNHFPCLVIRGISDYSDSHKNKQWQGYAALTAALYAKDLLSRISASRANAESRIMDATAILVLPLLSSMTRSRYLPQTFSRSY